MVSPTSTRPVAQAVKLKANSSDGRLNKQTDFEKRLAALKSKALISQKDTEESDEMSHPMLAQRYEADVQISPKIPSNAVEQQSVQKIQSRAVQESKTESESQALVQKEPLALALGKLVPDSPQLSALNSDPASVRTDNFDTTTRHLIKQMEAVERLEFSKKSEWHFKQIGPNHVQASIRMTQLDNGAWAMNVNLPQLNGQARVSTAELLKQHLMRRGHRIDALNMDVSDDADRDA